MAGELKTQGPWKDKVIQIDWAVDEGGAFECDPSAAGLNKEVLCSFPGWFKVTNLTNLNLADVSIQITVSDQARTWETSLNPADPGDEHNYLVSVGALAPKAVSKTVNFKWQVKHSGQRFQWDEFPVDFMLTPAYAVTYDMGWGPAVSVTAEPIKQES